MLISSIKDLYLFTGTWYAEMRESIGYASYQNILNLSKNKITDYIPDSF